MNNVWLALLTGLTTGGISCLAVQGGLLASSVAQDTESDILKVKKWQKVAMFLVAKLAAYTIVGFLLGLIGSSLILTPNILGFMQIFAGIFMLLTAARLLNIHPIFRYFVIQPPKWAYKTLKDQSKSKALFGPAILGTLTILIPCGITQAMMALAVASGSPLYGALIMFAFVIGTSPIFFAMGMAAVELFKRKALVYITSLVIIILGVLSINTGQVIRGSRDTIQNYWQAAGLIFNAERAVSGSVAKVTDGKQNVVITVRSNGYTTDTQKIRLGVPVKLTLVTNNVNSCARSFLIPSQGISKLLPATGKTEVEFTPTKLGALSFTCSMGMYTGSFNVFN